MIIQDADGNDIEVYSQEEADALAQEKAQEEADRVKAEKDAEMATLNEELAKLKEKDMNFERVRSKAEGKEIEVNEEVKKQVADLTARIEEIVAQPKNDVRDEFVRTRIGDDKEQVGRFNYYYDRLGGEAKTKEEVLRAANEALILASGGKYQPSDSGRVHSVGASQDYMNTGVTRETTEEAKSIGEALGITEEDRKKYGTKKGTS